MSTTIDIREVGLRDGLQLVKEFVPTETKLTWLRAEAQAGVRRFEVSSFVSSRVMPQFADAEVVVAEAQQLPGVNAAALALNRRGAERALEAGVGEITFVISASQAHSKGNAGRSSDQALAEFREVVAAVRSVPPERRPRVHGGVATAFGCPIEGHIDPGRVRALTSAMAEAGADEISIADTVGFANPVQVRELCRQVLADVAPLRVGIHLHDTRGLGLANAAAAIDSGVTALDAALGGIGGCPFAPGASGNIAMEDLVYLVHSMGHRTGIDLERLLEVRNTLPRWLPGEKLFGALSQAGIPAHQREALTTH